MDMQKRPFSLPTCCDDQTVLPWPGAMPEITPEPPVSDETGQMPSPAPDVTPDTGSSIPSDSIDPALLALAMGFVPRQSWEIPYDYDVALKRGTIFPALDKPFLGEEALSK